MYDNLIVIMNNLPNLPDNHLDRSEKFKPGPFVLSVLFLLGTVNPPASAQTYNVLFPQKHPEFAYPNGIPFGQVAGERLPEEYGNLITTTAHGIPSWNIKAFSELNIISWHSKPHLLLTARQGFNFEGIVSISDENVFSERNLLRNGENDRIQGEIVTDMPSKVNTEDLRFRRKDGSVTTLNNFRPGDSGSYLINAVTGEIYGQLNGFGDDPLLRITISDDPDPSRVVLVPFSDKDSEFYTLNLLRAGSKIRFEEGTPILFVSEVDIERGEITFSNGVGDDTITFEEFLGLDFDRSIITHSLGLLVTASDIEIFNKLAEYLEFADSQDYTPIRRTEEQPESQPGQ